MSESGETAVQGNDLLLEGVGDVEISYLAHVETDSGRSKGVDCGWSGGAGDEGEADLGQTVDDRIGRVDEGVCGRYSTGSGLVCGINAGLGAVC